MRARGHTFVQTENNMFVEFSCNTVRMATPKASCAQMHYVSMLLDLCLCLCLCRVLFSA